MNPQHYGAQPAQRNTDGQRQPAAPETRQEPRSTDAQASAEQAARSVMHPETHDPDWRYYHGALSG